MANDNLARKAIWPNNQNILVRVVFLYVGQGSTAVVFIAHGNSYLVVLVDINLDNGAGGIDVPRMMKDLLEGGNLWLFMNTHPHDDHLRGIEELADAVSIKNVADSGHIPSKKYGDSYANLKTVMDKVTKAGGNVFTLRGSNTPLAFGDAYCHVLAPAEYVTDDVNEDDADARYRRIHEQCAVLKFGKGAAWIMIAGDADRCAFEDHIVNYHGDSLSAYALGASHHGSRTFFRDTDDEDDELKAINPRYVVISAPKQHESKHDHPHDDAVELYENHVGSENVVHTGENRHCFIFDIYKDGKVSAPQNDVGVLAREYGFKDDDGGGAKALMGGFAPRTQEGQVGGPRRFA
jgi:beta-lactamase superfamily II metal-dependent hydrolase